MKTEENPFSGPVVPQCKKQFHMIHVYYWEWSKTENLSFENSAPYYDFQPGGRLFAGYADCPSCGSGSVILSAGFDDSGNCKARDWCCLDCGLSGDIDGEYGELSPTTNKDHDEYMALPECVVVSVDINDETEYASWIDRLRLYSQEKRRMMDANEPFDQEINLALVKKFKV